jgi:hypothetical protein
LNHSKANPQMVDPRGKQEQAQIRKPVEVEGAGSHLSRAKELRSRVRGNGRRSGCGRSGVEGGAPGVSYGSALAGVGGIGYTNAGMISYWLTGILMIFF